YDWDRAAAPPYLFDRTAAGTLYQMPATLNCNTNDPPIGAQATFLALANRTTAAVPGNSEFRTAGKPATDSSVDYRSGLTALARVNLNRFLVPYPHLGKIDPNTYDPTTYDPPPPPPFPLAAGTSLSGATPQAMSQFQRAQQDRQTLAGDIYTALVNVT